MNHPLELNTRFTQDGVTFVVAGISKPGEEFWIRIVPEEEKDNTPGENEILDEETLNVFLSTGYTIESPSAESEAMDVESHTDTSEGEHTHDYEFDDHIRAMNSENMAQILLDEMRARGISTSEAVRLATQCKVLLDAPKFSRWNPIDNLGQKDTGAIMPLVIGQVFHKIVEDTSPLTNDRGENCFDLMFNRVLKHSDSTKKRKYSAITDHIEKMSLKRQLRLQELVFEPYNSFTEINRSPTTRASTQLAENSRSTSIGIVRVSLTESIFNEEKIIKTSDFSDDATHSREFVVNGPYGSLDMKAVVVLPPIFDEILRAKNKNTTLHRRIMLSKLDDVRADLFAFRMKQHVITLLEENENAEALKMALSGISDDASSKFGVKVLNTFSAEAHSVTAEHRRHFTLRLTDNKQRLLLLHEGLQTEEPGSVVAFVNALSHVGLNLTDLSRMDIGAIQNYILEIRDREIEDEKNRQNLGKQLAAKDLREYSPTALHFLLNSLQTAVEESTIVADRQKEQVVAVIRGAWETPSMELVDSLVALLSHLQHLTLASQETAESIVAHRINRSNPKKYATNLPRLVKQYDTLESAHNSSKPTWDDDLFKSCKSLLGTTTTFEDAFEFLKIIVANKNYEVEEENLRVIASCVTGTGKEVADGEYAIVRDLNKYVKLDEGNWIEDRSKDLQARLNEFTELIHLLSTPLVSKMRSVDAGSKRDLDRKINRVIVEHRAHHHKRQLSVSAAPAETETTATVLPVPSPNQQRMDDILASSTSEERWKDLYDFSLQHFVGNSTSDMWWYCADTGIRLLPILFTELAFAYINRGNNNLENFRALLHSENVENRRNGFFCKLSGRLIELHSDELDVEVVVDANITPIEHNSYTAVAIHFIREFDMQNFDEILTIRRFNTYLLYFNTFMNRIENTIKIIVEHLSEEIQDLSRQLSGNLSEKNAEEKRKAKNTFVKDLANVNILYTEICKESTTNNAVAENRHTEIKLRLFTFILWKIMEPNNPEVDDRVFTIYRRAHNELKKFDNPVDANSDQSERDCMKVLNIYFEAVENKTSFMSIINTFLFKPLGDKVPFVRRLASFESYGTFRPKPARPEEGPANPIALLPNDLRALYEINQKVRHSPSQEILFRGRRYMVSANVCCLPEANAADANQRLTPIEYFGNDDPDLRERVRFSEEEFTESNRPLPLQTRVIGKANRATVAPDVGFFKNQTDLQWTILQTNQAEAMEISPPDIPFPEESFKTGINRSIASSQWDSVLSDEGMGVYELLREFIDDNMDAGDFRVSMQLVFGEDKKKIGKLVDFTLSSVLPNPQNLNASSTRKNRNLPKGFNAAVKEFYAKFPPSKPAVDSFEGIRQAFDALLRRDPERNFLTLWFHMAIWVLVTFWTKSQTTVSQTALLKYFESEIQNVLVITEEDLDREWTLARRADAERVVKKFGDMSPIERRVYRSTHQGPSRNAFSDELTAETVADEDISGHAADNPDERVGEAAPAPAPGAMLGDPFDDIIYSSDEDEL